LDKGWKAAKLAAELGVSETTLGRWENGRQQPTLGHQQRLCEVLDKEPVELGFQGDILEVGTRREFMRQVTALVGTATMEAVLDIGGPDALDRFSLAVGHPTRVDRATVQHLETVTATHRELYHHLSSLELVDAVTGHLRGVTRLLRGAQHRVLRRRLAAVAGETAGHAAWLFHDLGDQKMTDRYYAEAAIATRKAVIRHWMRMCPASRAWFEPAKANPRPPLRWHGPPARQGLVAPPPPPVHGWLA
jgi:transcriptional regulator with XRE-family HTH domain